ncbi:MAG TPA: hypothetical protein VNW71_15120 [Thermoanaerobaculia bacterium]|nr:hypothetical protein [Thermoanaerobaculia bacterium]
MLAGNALEVIQTVGEDRRAADEEFGQPEEGVKASASVPAIP